MRHKNQPYTFEEVRQEALKYKTRGEFFVGGKWAYICAKNNGWFDLVVGHMKVPFRWTDEALKAEALKYEHRRRFFEGNKRAYVTCCLRGILDEACAHMEKLPSATDADVIYIWRVLEHPDIYKIGITSKRCGESRIDLCQYNNKGIFTPQIIIMQECRWAKQAEQHLHAKFTDCPDIGAKDGSKEFRRLTSKQLVYAINYLTKEY